MQPEGVVNQTPVKKLFGILGIECYALVVVLNGPLVMPKAVEDEAPAVVALGILAIEVDCGLQVSQWLVRLGPVRPGDGFYGLRVVGLGLRQSPQPVMEVAPRDKLFRPLGVELDGFVRVSNRLLVLALTKVHKAAKITGLGILRANQDRLV
jgi:hypothetical protein